MRRTKIRKNLAHLLFDCGPEDTKVLLGTALLLHSGRKHIGPSCRSDDPANDEPPHLNDVRMQGTIL